MTLTYINAGGEPDSVISMSNENYAIFMSRLANAAANHAKELEDSFDRASDALGRYEDGSDEEYYDEDYHEFLNRNFMEASQAHAKARDLAYDLEGIISENCPDFQLLAGEWLQLVGILTGRSGGDSHILDYCSRLTQELGHILEQQGNPYCYWA